MPIKVTENFNKTEDGELISEEGCGKFQDLIYTLSFKIGEKFIKLKPNAFLIDQNEKCKLALVVG